MKGVRHLAVYRGSFFSSEERRRVGFGPLRNRGRYCLLGFRNDILRGCCTCWGLDSGGL